MRANEIRITRFKWLFVHILQYSDKNFQFNDQLSKIVGWRRNTRATNVKVGGNRATNEFNGVMHLFREKIAAINDLYTYLTFWFMKVNLKCSNFKFNDFVIMDFGNLCCHQCNYRPESNLSDHASTLENSTFSRSHSCIPNIPYQ